MHTHKWFERHDTKQVKIITSSSCGSPLPQPTCLLWFHTHHHWPGYASYTAVLPGTPGTCRTMVLFCGWMTTYTVNPRYSTTLTKHQQRFVHYKVFKFTALLNIPPNTVLNSGGTMEFDSVCAEQFS